MAKTAYLQQRGRVSRAAKPASPARRTVFDNRRRLMAAILAACKRRNMDGDDRKALQHQITGVASMADMNVAQLGKLLDHLNNGWTAPMAHRSHIGKIRALWWSLYWLGQVDSGSDQSLSAFVRRQTGLSSLTFVDHHNAPAIIEALKSWLTRAGVRWPDVVGRNRGRSEAAQASAAIAERQSVLAAIISHIDATGYLAFEGHQTFPETTHELDAAIIGAGKLWRELKERMNHAN